METIEGRLSKSAQFIIAIASLIVIAALASCASSQTGRDDTPPSFSGNGPGGTGQAPGGMPPSGGGPGGSSGTGSQSMSGEPGVPLQQTAPSLEKKNYSRYFTDLNEETADYNAYVDYLVEQGLIETGKGLYRPKDTLTRSEFAVILYARYKFTGEGSGSAYADVQADTSYYQAVMRGKAAKVLQTRKTSAQTRR